MPIGKFFIIYFQAHWRVSLRNLIIALLKSSTYVSTDPGDAASLYYPKMSLLSEELLRSGLWLLGSMWEPIYPLKSTQMIWVPLGIMAMVPWIFSEVFLTGPVSSWVPLIFCCLIWTVWVLLLVSADSLADKLCVVFVCNTYLCTQEKLFGVNFYYKAEVDLISLNKTSRMGKSAGVLLISPCPYIGTIKVA